MPDEPVKKRHRRTFPWIVILLMLPGLYVFSYAPAVMIWQSRTEPPGGTTRLLLYFYEPAAWLHKSTPLQKPLGEWATLWGVDPDFWRLHYQV